MSEAVRVIYIMGSGRSGSTVLDTVLGAHPRVESVGELATLTQQGWIADSFCACGRRGAECEFWTRVRHLFEANGGDVESYARLQQGFERLRSLRRVLRARKRPDPDFEAWGRQTLALFRAVRAASGKSVIVDSSKLPVRALALGLVPGLDVSCAHLVRDGRGVAWSLARSWAKDPASGIERDLAGRSLVRSTLTWATVNAITGFVRRRAPRERGTLLRYEDYVRDLPGALHAFSEFVGEDLRGLGQEVTAGRELAVGHTVAGNRLRMQGKVRLQPDTRWREGMPAWKRRFLWGLAWPWMQAYGYRM